MMLLASSTHGERTSKCQSYQNPHCQKHKATSGSCQTLCCPESAQISGICNNTEDKCFTKAPCCPWSYQLPPLMAFESQEPIIPEGCPKCTRNSFLDRLCFILGDLNKAGASGPRDALQDCSAVSSQGTVTSGWIKIAPEGPCRRKVLSIIAREKQKGQKHPPSVCIANGGLHESGQWA